MLGTEGRRDAAKPEDGVREPDPGVAHPSSWSPQPLRGLRVLPLTWPLPHLPVLSVMSVTHNHFLCSHALGENQGKEAEFRPHLGRSRPQRKDAAGGKTRAISKLSSRSSGSKADGTVRIQTSRPLQASCRRWRTWGPRARLGHGEGKGLLSKNGDNHC